MRVSVLVAILLLVFCVSVNGLWWRRHRGSSSSTTTTSTTVTGTITTTTTTTTTNSGKKKRSSRWNGNHYNITLTVDQCNFNTYDNLRRDGTIDEGELHAIFGSTELADALFADLDEMGDGIVTKEDFNDRAPIVITACMDTKK